MGPYGRFDHHTVGTRALPALDPEHRILYAADDIPTALLEIYVDAGELDPTGRSLSVLVVREPIRLLDIRGPLALEAGATFAMNATPLRKDTQPFARDVYASPVFEYPDGIVFNSALDAATVYAFFERAEAKLVLFRSVALDHPNLRSPLLSASRRLGIPLAIASFDDELPDE